MHRNILITGANGFFGSFVMKEFNEYNLRSLGKSNCDYNIDLSKSIPHFDSDFNVVVHAAGKAHFIPKNLIEEKTFLENNINGTINLLKGLERGVKPKKFVFISSVSVYGKLSGDLISEENELKADDPYGKSKIIAEKIIQEWCHKNEVICTILRLPLLVGLNPPGNLGSMINAINKGYYFNIGGGVARKSMVMATDVAKHILIASNVGGIYNLTDGQHPSFKDFSNLISSQLNKKHIPNMPIIFAIILAFIGDIIGEAFPINSKKLKKLTKDLTFDDSKARISFGWRPKSVLKEFYVNK